jgi:hypothetical protein
MFELKLTSSCSAAMCAVIPRDDDQTQERQDGDDHHGQAHHLNKP